MTQILVYILWVGCSFIFIACVPSAEAHNFLSIYAVGSFAASMFSIPIYTTWRNKMFDILFSTSCILSVAGLYFGYLIPLFFASAVAVNIVDFSVAQVQRSRAVIVMRLAISLSSLAVLIGFKFGLCLRLLICSLAIIWSTQHKDYSQREAGWFSTYKARLTAITCALYYIPLACTPHLAQQSPKFVYIVYAASGSIILKIQDYIIKMNVTRGSVAQRTDRTFYFMLCGATTVFLALALAWVNPLLIILCIPIIGLIATIWMVDNVSWA